jgi:hydrogenase expression/formation protein HypC
MSSREAPAAALAIHRGVTDMCLGIPMQIKAIDGYTAHCEAKGVQRTISLFMMQDAGLQVDDYVVVHVGYAIQKITPQEARTAWELYDEMLAGGSDA